MRVTSRLIPLTMSAFVLFALLGADLAVAQNWACGLLYEDPRTVPSLVEVTQVQPLPGAPVATSTPAVNLTAQMPPVGNQGRQSSCVAWAVGYYHKTQTEWLEYHWDLTQTSHQISPAFVYNQINGGNDFGSYLSDATRLICDQGACMLSDLHYDDRDFKSWPSESAFSHAIPFRGELPCFTDVTTDSGLLAVKQRLDNGNTSVLGITVWSYFDTIQHYNNTYTVHDKHGSKLGGHAVCIVGYDDTKQTHDGLGAFELVNSWGTGWGLSGYFWMSYQAVKDTSAELSQGTVYFATDKIGYQPTLLARVQLTHRYRDAVRIRLGVGPSAAPFWIKDFRQFRMVDSGQTAPESFPDNNMVFDMTEGAFWITGGYTDLAFVRCEDTISDRLSGWIDYFSAQYLPWSVMGVSSDPPVSIPDYKIAVYAGAQVVRTIAFSDLPWATSPAQGKHIVRSPCPGTHTVYVVYQKSDGIYLLNSSDGGRNWSSPEPVASGCDPCISLDWQGTPWVAYRSNNYLYCSVRRAPGNWGQWPIYYSLTAAMGPPSMVCSNYRDDAQPFPPPQCDMGYAVFVTYPASGYATNHRALMFVPFDTIHQDRSMPGAYNYGWGIKELHEPGLDSSGESDSMPCISRTPGDYLHVTWKMGEGPTGNDQVVYTTTDSGSQLPTNPPRIRDSCLNPPIWTPTALLSTDAQGSEPSNDAYADRIMALWRAGSRTDVGVIDENARPLGYRWPLVPNQWSADTDESGNPAASRTAGVWLEQFTGLTGNINSRSLGDQQPLRLTSAAANQICPQADVELAEYQGGTDTMRLVWTESGNGPCAIKFAFRLRQNTGPDGYYRVACGQDTPSPYCLQRDGAAALGGHSIDYAESALVYRLRYLNPLCRYSIRAVAYQSTAGSIQESFKVGEAGNSTEASAQAAIPPNTPVEVWLDVPPSLYHDGVVDFTVRKLQGSYAVLAGLTLYERDGDTSQMGGGQSGKINPDLLPRGLVLEQSWPNPATRTLTIRYGIPRLTNVSLKVYDISGKVVRTLETSNLLKPGYYNINWNCRDDQNREIAGGVYFYRLVTSDNLRATGIEPAATVRTRKLVVAR